MLSVAFSLFGCVRALLYPLDMYFYHCCWLLLLLLLLVLLVLTAVVVVLPSRLVVKLLGTLCIDQRCANVAFSGGGYATTNVVQCRPLHKVTVARTLQGSIDHDQTRRKYKQTSELAHQNTLNAGGVQPAHPSPNAGCKACSNDLKMRARPKACRSLNTSRVCNGVWIA